MAVNPLDDVAKTLAALDTSDAMFATRAVDRIVAAGRQAGASDIHWQPSADGLEVRFRIDGVLERVAVIPGRVAQNVIARLKVLADLLTYHTDAPQEGRLRMSEAPAADGLDMRLSTFPTLYGEKAVVRLFGGGRCFLSLDELGMPDDVTQPLGQLLGETAGAIIVSGPAGSGKTTTAYACLRELIARHQGARAMSSIEDPIEVAVPGVAQSQVNATSGLTLAVGLRFLMRQDPEVILVGEIRDPATAEAAMQASLTGQLVVSTFHAGSAAETVSRLLDMGIEPYVLRSGLLAIVHQRLVRRLCACSRPIDNADERLGLPVEHARRAVGCAACGGTGYAGRQVIVEMFRPDRGRLGDAILSRQSARQLERRAIRAGMKSRWQRAVEAVELGVTSPEEIRRVLGFLATTPPTGR